MNEQDIAKLREIVKALWTPTRVIRDQWRKEGGNVLLDKGSNFRARGMTEEDAQLISDILNAVPELMRMLDERDAENAAKDKRIVELEKARPFVTFIEGGRLQLEWDNGDRHLEIEFGDANWLTQKGDVMESGDLDSEDGDSCQQLRDMLNWVYGISLYKEATDANAK